MNAFAGKTALITGSGRGIGREIALKLASEGANVVVNDLDEAPAQETVELIGKLGSQAVAVVGSVTEAGFAERFVGAAVENFGGIDIIVNNAGYGWGDVIWRQTDEQWEAMLDVHAKAPFQILRAAQPVISRLAKQEAARGETRHRKVVNISSGAAEGIPGNSAYASGKAAVIGLTKTMAKEWGRYRVNVNAVAFGVIDTRLTAPAGEDSNLSVSGDKEISVGATDKVLAAFDAFPCSLARRGTVQEAAGAIYLLCRPESDYISGQLLTCAGG
ncbi:SDR family NAD(P)-dependent oxidoreductase [Streptomyces adustus]|uniref:SDR family NAD(P)-dependent oxidoreductase n=1 Tax=Streptomyces adustus TaxID=1609272 RepID=UPI003721BECE